MHSLKFPDLITLKTAKTFIRNYCLSTALEDALNWQKAASDQNHVVPNILNPNDNISNVRVIKPNPAESTKETFEVQDWGTFKYVSTDESGSDDEELRGYISTVELISFEL